MSYLLLGIGLFLFFYKMANIENDVISFADKRYRNNVSNKNSLSLVVSDRKAYWSFLIYPFSVHNTIHFFLPSTALLLLFQLLIQLPPASMGWLSLFNDQTFSWHLSVLSRWPAQIATSDNDSIADIFS